MTKQSPDFWRKIAAMLVAKHGGTETLITEDAASVDGKTLVVVEGGLGGEEITLHVVTPEQAAAMARELESTHDKD